AFYWAEGAKILTDVGSAHIVQNSDEKNREKSAALGFLEHYLIAYKGDRVAFELKLGKRSEEVWTLQQAFVAFMRSINHHGVTNALDFNISPLKLDDAYQYLVDYMMSHGVIAIKPSTNPLKTAYRGWEGGLEASITYGENIDFILELDPYLEQLGCYFLDHKSPVLSGLSGSAVEETTPTSVKHRNLFVSGTREVSLSQDFTLRCRGDNHQITYIFSDDVLIPATFFQLSESPNVSRSAHQCSTLAVDVELPPVDQFFMGTNGEVFDAAEKLIVVTLEEKVDPGRSPNQVTKEFRYIAYDVSRRPSIALETSFDDHGFFFDHSGGRDFHLHVEVPNSGLWVKSGDSQIDGAGSLLEWSWDFTVSAAETTFYSEFGDVRILVPNARLANWDASRRELTLGENDNFQICFKEPYDGSDGPLLYYRVLFYDANGGTSIEDGLIVDSTAVDSETGCADFTRVRPQHTVLNSSTPPQTDRSSARTAPSVRRSV
ncbi:hypothetical protein U5801_26320, partial [Lamprobacter modestohalophilus]|uniref:hypothetical protein n=1 Tax=Lamprobacter modestohalophilus TaxID=1064514 RepID=UPI002ADEA803